MLFERFRKKKEVKKENVVTFHRDAVLIARSVDFDDFDPVQYGKIKEQLKENLLIDGKVLPKVATAQGVAGEYPEDYGDYNDYYDSYAYIPFVTQAVNIKHMLLWQNGFDTESEKTRQKKAADRFLKEINADTVLREGTLHGLITGNCYWLGEKKGGKWTFTVLDSRHVLLANDGKSFLYIENKKQPKNIPELTPNTVKGILHLPFNKLGGKYGVSSLKHVLPTIKSLLYMERYMPKIVRKRGDPPLSIKITAANEDEFKRIKEKIVKRKSTEDIFHDGTLEIEEVYKTTPRFGVMEVVQHFRDNLVAGLGVPEVALGFGGTTTMATAEYQERLLIGELRGYQRQIKRFIEQKLFPLAGIKDVTITWRPIKGEDLNVLSERYCREIEHGVLSPKYASQLLGYPEAALEDAVIKDNLIPSSTSPEQKSAEKFRRKKR